MDMGIIKKFSFSALVGRFDQSFRRFPVAMLLVLFLTGFLIYLNHGGDDAVSDKMTFLLIFYPATGALLAVALSLLTEDFRNKIVVWTVPVLAQIAWFAVSAYLAQFDRFSMTQMIAVSATVASFAFAIFLLCFYRKNQDMPFWNFSIRIILALIVSCAIGGILTLGLLLLVESLKMLFAMDIDSSVYIDIWIVCMVLLAPSLFMALIPKGSKKYLNAVPEYSRFGKGVMQYLFLPLLGLYLITLYAYGVKILLQWSLPVGGVSYLVTGSMMLMVLLIYFSYPLQHLEGNKLFKRVTRWLPVVMLPLLSLMTVAIGRRLADYGITVSRLYLLVFNLWCYAVCLWLIFTRNKRIWLIPASFALILFLVSVGPYSIPNVTQRQLKKEISNAFAATGVKQLPLTGEQYEQWLKTANPEVAVAMDSKLDYLRSDYGFETVSDLIAKDAVLGNLQTKDGVVVTGENEAYSNAHLIDHVAVPQGYSKLTNVYFCASDLVVKDNHVSVDMSDIDEVEHKFDLDLKAFAARDDSRTVREVGSGKNVQTEPLVIDNGKELLMIDEFYVSRNKDATCYINFEGILFTK
jgi:hypothetical protein